MGQKDRIRTTIPIHIGAKFTFVPQGENRTWKRDGVYEVKQIEGTTARLERATGETVEIAGLLKKGKLHLPSDTSARGTLEHLVKMRAPRTK